MRYEVTVSGLGNASGKPFSLGNMLSHDDAVVTDISLTGAQRETPIVLSWTGGIIMPEDMPSPISLNAALVPAADVERIRAAGYTVEVLAWCEYCGEKMTEAEARAGRNHSACVTEAQAALDTVSDPTNEYAAWLRTVLA